MRGIYLASFALLFVQNYAILELSDKISTGRWWIPKCCFFTALKLDNAHLQLINYFVFFYKYVEGILFFLFRNRIQFILYILYIYMWPHIYIYIQYISMPVL